MINRQDGKTDPYLLFLNRFKNREKRKTPDQRVGALACRARVRVFVFGRMKRPYDPVLFDQSAELVQKRHRIEERASIAHA